MVRILIRMRAAMIAHRTATRFGTVATILVVLFALVSAAATLLIGVTKYPTPAAGSDVVAITMAVWVIGRVAYAAFAGGGSTLRFELFRMLPVPVRTLSRALLVVGLLDPALLFLAIAFGSLVVLGAQGSAAAAVVGAVGALLTLALTSVLVSMVGALLASGARRRQDLGTMVVAIVISLVAIAGTLLPTFADAFTRGRLPGLSLAVRILPSGWAAVAVDGARSGDAVGVVLPLLGLVILTAALVSVWPVLLKRRLDGTIGSSNRGRAHRRAPRILPATPTGAVVSKELRLWLREPVRVTFLMIGAIVGLGATVIPGVSHGTSILFPFAGAMTVVIAGAAGANLLGSDGLALRLTVLTPGSEAPDVRGRQLAWLLLVGPYALLLSVLLTVVSGQNWAWPWVFAVLPALLGGAAGLIPLASVTAVQTLDDNGGLTPGWPVKVYAVLFLIVVSALPALALLFVGLADGSLVIEWLAVPLGIATGIVFAVLLGRLAVRRFVSRELPILALLTAASSPA